MKIENRKIGLVSLLAVGVGSIVGSGWLFAAYYAAKSAGHYAIFSWLIGAVIYILMAVALSEIVSMYPQRGLFTRLVSISHNKHYGFVTALSNWLATIFLIPSEAEATVQYVSTIKPSYSQFIFQHDHLTALGLVFVIALILLFCLANYWGVKYFAKFNNFLVSLKIIVPIATIIILFCAAFHSANFHLPNAQSFSQNAANVFNSIVSSGIVYAFFGFQFIVSFAAEAKNAKRNLPIALIGSIVLCLIIYLLLQIAFIGALPATTLSHGWQHLNFTSPLVQLSMLLGLNFWVVVLYADACASPSGSAVIYMGAATRMLTAMSQEKQMPQYFSKLHDRFYFSRRSLIFSVACCCFIIFFFKSWSSIVLLISALQLLSCIAIPLSLSRLRLDQPQRHRPFKAPMYQALSLSIYFLLTFLLLTAGVESLYMTLLLHLVFFVVYSLVSNNYQIRAALLAIKSAYSMFIYMAFLALFAELKPYFINTYQQPLVFYSGFVVAAGIIYYLLLKQPLYLEEQEKLVMKTNQV